MSTIRFSGTFSRDGKTLPVSGEVSDHTGQWHGTFTFSTRHAPTISPGNAQLITDSAGTWDILVRSTQTSGGAGQGVSIFRVQGGL